MIAYVFWHNRKAGVDRATYVDALRVFHSSLMATKPRGLLRTMSFSTSGVPWLTAAPETFEDWHLLENSGALDALNEAAVTGHRQTPHDYVAAMAAAGTAGLYSLRLGELPENPPKFAHWLSKPEAMPYHQFFDSLRATCVGGVALWGRQMVLGPTTEFCVQAQRRLSLPYPGLVHELSSLFDQK